jgi:CRISPR-associated protein Cas2
MMVLVTYDVNTETAAGRKRLKKVSDLCQDYGQRVQNSVFECILDPAQLKILQNGLENIINTEKDSIRYYNLGKDWQNRVQHIGAKVSLRLDKSLIV